MTLDESNDPVTLDDVDATAATARAVLCVVENEEIWIPRSQILPESEVHEVGDTGALVIPKWLAEREGLA